MALPADELRLCMVQDGEEVQVYEREKAPVIRKKEYRRHLEKEERAVWIDFPLFYQEYQYGILSVDIPLDDVLFYHTLSLEIGSGLRYLQISMGEQTAKKSLAAKNRIHLVNNMDK